MSRLDDQWYNAAVSMSGDIAHSDNRYIQHFKTIIDQSSDIYFIIDVAADRITYVNTAVEPVLGYTVREAMHRKPRSMMTPSAMARLCDTMYQRIASGHTSDKTIHPRSCIWNDRKYKSVAHAAKACGITREAMRQRIANGYTCDDDLKR